MFFNRDLKGQPRARAPTYPHPLLYLVNFITHFLVIFGGFKRNLYIPIVSMYCTFTYAFTVKINEMWADLPRPWILWVYNVVINPSILLDFCPQRPCSQLGFKRHQTPKNNAPCLYLSHPFFVVCFFFNLKKCKHISPNCGLTVICHGTVRKKTQ